MKVMKFRQILWHYKDYDISKKNINTKGKNINKYSRIQKLIFGYVFFRDYFFFQFRDEKKIITKLEKKNFKFQFRTEKKNNLKSSRNWKKIEKIPFSYRKRKCTKF